jgi:hypothetical protein
MVSVHRIAPSPLGDHNYMFAPGGLLSAVSIRPPQPAMLNTLYLEVMLYRRSRGPGDLSRLRGEPARRCDDAAQGFAGRVITFVFGSLSCNSFCE